MLEVETDNNFEQPKRKGSTSRCTSVSADQRVLRKERAKMMDFLILLVLFPAQIFNHGTLFHQIDSYICIFIAPYIWLSTISTIKKFENVIMYGIISLKTCRHSAYGFWKGLGEKW